MHRFFVDSPVRPGSKVSFSPQAARQMARVLRLRPGDRVAAVSSEGWEGIVVLEEVGRKGARGRVEEIRRRDTEAAIRFWLAQGLPRGEKMDWVVQKATELGVERIFPVLTSRSVARPDREALASRVRRWEEIAREAAEQAGRTRIPQVEAPVSLAEALGELKKASLFLVPWEEEREQKLHQALRGRLVRGTVLSFLIGPEGGLTREEVESCRREGGVTVSLGSRLLRTETAGTVLMAAALYEAGEF
jgi:16S rRNA (uracil1498-N3)-methyltransferase